jgi:hypothetical protein
MSRERRTILYLILHPKSTLALPNEPNRAPVEQSVICGVRLEEDRLECAKLEVDSRRYA